MVKTNAFHKSLRSVRVARGLSQEALGDLSSRTYVSTLERGLKSPTLHKVEQLAAMLNVSPLTLLVLAYVPMVNAERIDQVLAQVKSEIQDLNL